MKKAMVFGIGAILIFSFLSGCLIPTENVPPVPYLTASGTFIDVDQEVVFSANLSKDKDGEIVRYFWTFDDDETATGKYVTHKYEKGGNYTVVLIITDNDGKKAVQTITIHVNELPDPWIEMTLPIYIHEPVYFYGNDSYDEDGYVKDYFWDFGDGTNKSGISTSHTYSEKKQFRVTLTITDNDGGKAASSRVFNISYRTYQVEWREGSIVVFPTIERDLIEGDSYNRLIDISIFNMTRAFFNLTWDDDIPNIDDPLNPTPNDEFILNVTSPDEIYYEKNAIVSEKIKIYAPGVGSINPKPPEFKQEAESEKILRGYLGENYTTNEGTGDWLINITLIEAKGAKEFPIPIDVDNGDNWNFNVTCNYYYPWITKLD
jgi:chitodextrinase